MNKAADKWNNIYSQQCCENAKAATVLAENVHLLPTTAKALDMASGLGGNAILMAKHHLQVEAWDISNIALEKLNEYSRANHLNITTKLRDIENNPPEKNYFNVIVVTQFLHRPTFNNLIESLITGGLLIYQTFCIEKVDNIGPSNPNYLLEKNELLHLCRDMQILVYREEGLQGNTQQGWRNQAMVIAKK